MEFFNYFSRFFGNLKKKYRIILTKPWRITYDERA